MASEKGPKKSSKITSFLKAHFTQIWLANIGVRGGGSGGGATPQLWAKAIFTQKSGNIRSFLDKTLNKLITLINKINFKKQVGRYSITKQTLFDLLLCFLF